MPATVAPCNPPAVRIAKSTSDRHEPRIYRVVADRIRKLVRQDGIQPGMRLPSERDLAARLAVSRASLREAVIALELTGEVEVRSGSGVYLTGHASGKPRSTHPVSSLSEMLAARQMIEPHLAATAARFASNEAIDALLAAVDALERPAENAQADAGLYEHFHRTLAQATGNGALAGVMDYLLAQYRTLQTPLQQDDALRLATLADHRRLAYAIARRDPATAKRATRTLLQRIT